MFQWVGHVGLLFLHLLSEGHLVLGLQHLSLDFQESLAVLIVVGLSAALFQVLHEAVSLQCSKCPMNCQCHFQVYYYLFHQSQRFVDCYFVPGLVVPGVVVSGTSNQHYRRPLIYRLYHLTLLHELLQQFLQIVPQLCLVF